MIRLALAFLGLSAGAVSAQGMVPTAPIVETCGGTRLVLAADGAPTPDDLDTAAEVVSARVGGLMSNVFDYTAVSQGRIVLSLPDALNADIAVLTPLFDRVDFGFHSVDRAVETESTVALQQGDILLPAANEPWLSYVVRETAILNGASIMEATQNYDQNGRPAIFFAFTEAGGQTFGAYTSEHIGEPFAIVADGKVLSAPVIQSPIMGGRGMITGLLSEDEAISLAAILQGGVLAFDLEIVEEIRVDGSDPSADFCP